MMPSRLLRGLCCAFALACLGPACARAALPGGFTRANLAGVPVHAVAERILGRDFAANIESYSLDANLVYPGGALMSARFFGRPHAATAEICARNVDIVDFSPIEGLSDATLSRDSPSHVARFARATEISYAPGCRLAAGQAFAFVGEHIGPETAMRALAALAAARRAASLSGRLPLRYTCRDDLHGDHCRGDGRAALATLPLEQVLRIEVDAGGGIGFDLPGERVFWALRLTGLGTDQAALTIVAQAPPPF
jgi:hypothetical protein